jgi:CHC2 zinc finger
MSTRPKLDFPGIKRASPIVKVAQLLNLDLKRDGNGFRCPCPVGGGDHRAIRITPGHQNNDGSLGAWYCHSCSDGGDAIKLYAHIKACNNYDAAAELAKRFNVEPSAPTRAPQPPGAEGLKALDYLTTNHELIEALGLSAEVCEAIGIGYANKGTMNGRIAVPIRLQDGTLIGYFGIATKPEQKPLLKFPDNLAEKIGLGGIVEEVSEPKSPDDMRKLLRVV